MKIQISFFPLVIVFISLFFSVYSHSSSLERDEDRITLSFYSTDVPVRFIVVEKSTQRLLIFEQKESLKLLKTFICATGENPGKKIISGDSRTPEGVYFITEIYEDKKITVFGSRAYHLDYPNVFDKHAGHRGDGIFIHGTNKPLIPFSSNGCITLANQDLDELATYLTINNIPIIILEILPESLIGTDPQMSKNDLTFSRTLDQLSLSSQYFSPDNIETLSFITFQSQAIASISYRVYDENSAEYRYHKRVYLAPTVSNNWRTLYSVESQDIIPTLLAQHPVKNLIIEQPPPPEVVAVPEAPAPPETVTESVVKTVADTPTDAVTVPIDRDKELLAFVSKWKAAWVNKDIDTYMQCYGPSFKNGRLNRDGWRKKKSYLNKKYSFIKVTIRDIAIKWTDAGANVSFYQIYQSDKYKSNGTKRLQLINRDNKWMIQKEVM